MTFFSRRFVRRRIISLATTLTFSATSFALAQAPKGALHLQALASEADEQQFLFANGLAISNMSTAMLVKPAGDVDRDFAAAMVPHYQGAIDIARAELKFGHDPELRRMAEEIVAQRGREMSVMRHAIGEPSTRLDGNPSLHPGTVLTEASAN